MGEDEGGHDFAIIDDRFLADVWYQSVYDPDAPTLFDMEDPEDLAEVKRLYGDPATWKEVKE